jgi:L-alanine-DL-glutamate epimerase-like enolase superfamily enzyme
MLQPTTMTATGLAPGLPAARDIVEHVLKPILVGQDPLSTEKLWDDMFWRCATWRHTM